MPYPITILRITIFLNMSLPRAKTPVPVPGPVAIQIETQSRVTGRDQVKASKRVPQTPQSAVMAMDEFSVPVHTPLRKQSGKYHALPRIFQKHIILSIRICGVQRSTSQLNRRHPRKPPIPPPSHLHRPLPLLQHPTPPLRLLKNKQEPYEVQLGVTVLSASLASAMESTRNGHSAPSVTGFTPNRAHPTSARR